MSPANVPRQQNGGTAISVHSSAALMMTAVDLLRSAFWAPERAVVRNVKDSPNVLFCR